MLLTVLKLPAPELLRVSEPVTSFDHELRKLASDMLETMYRANGIGLAAPQVGRNIRLVVMDVSRGQNSPWVFANPTITYRKGQCSSNEACLSVPERRVRVLRARQIRVEWVDVITEQRQDRTFRDLGAACLQHEIDHLDGVLLTHHWAGQALNKQFKEPAP